MSLTLTAFEFCVSTPGNGPFAAVRFSDGGFLLRFYCPFR
ncbi:hypothetical protein AEST_24620 [Alishewanella aestuarii B11]|uniref:Uncharacterized protein n=1 Tax=Alishewanella aestuarii B11 TaxID=1197174 RepID=J2ICD3_9ALTE|nr:hypothetical protein AEST_24620 [Alishewanella aestuarii B11]